MSRIHTETTRTPSRLMDHLCACLQGPAGTWRGMLGPMLREEALDEEDWASIESELFRRLPSRTCYLLLHIAHRCGQRQAAVGRMLVQAASRAMDEQAHLQNRPGIEVWAGRVLRRAKEYHRLWPDRYDTHKKAAIAAQELHPFQVSLALLDEAHTRREADSDPEAFLCLAPALLTRIGSTMHVDTLLKAQHLGWSRPIRLLCVFDPTPWGNAHLVERYLSTWVEFMPRQEAPPEILDALERRDSWYELACAQQGTMRFMPAATIAARHAWETQGHAPLFCLSAEDRAFGEAFLRTQGFEPPRRFVTFHARSESNAFTAYRNSQILAMVPAMEWLVEQGFGVIRIGDGSMPPLPAMPGVLDFATAFPPSPRLNVYFMTACAFFVGSASGPLTVPQAFGVSTVSVDTLPLGAACGTRRDTYLANPVCASDSGLPQAWDKAFSIPASLAHFTHQWHRLGIRPVDNEAIDILQAIQFHAVKSHLLPTRSAPSLPLPSKETVERFRRLADFPSTPCTEPIRAELSPPFMKRFAHLLPEGHG